MNIFIDESGTFVSANEKNSWCCVAAYVSPEGDTRKVRKLLDGLKTRLNVSKLNEIKLRNIPEENYIQFLIKLNGLNGRLFSVATDSGFNKASDIKIHQQKQVDGILKYKQKMKYDTGKQAVQLLADQILELSPQLYAQLHCQVYLIHDLLQRGIVYFVQRLPNTLSNFRWRLDQKNSEKPTFEEAFEKFAPGLLQTRSFSDPIIFLKGADYSSFSKYEYQPGEMPTYLSDEYGIDLGDDPGVNLGKLLRENYKFTDSKEPHGIQIADLLATGIRRCLRNEFRKNDAVARLLGELMIQGEHKKPPIDLIGFMETIIDKSEPTYRILKIMTRHSRRMLI